MERELGPGQIHKFLSKGLESAQDVRSIADYVLANTNPQTDPEEGILEDLAIRRIKNLLKLDYDSARVVLQVEIEKLKLEKP